MTFRLPAVYPKYKGRKAEQQRQHINQQSIYQDLHPRLLVPFESLLLLKLTVRVGLPLNEATAWVYDHDAAEQDITLRNVTKWDHRSYWLMLSQQYDFYAEKWDITQWNATDQDRRNYHFMINKLYGVRTW